MPARKPTVLVSMNETKAARSARLEADKRLTPKRELSLTPPSELKGHKKASAMWKILVDLYNSVEGGKIATAFDEEMLKMFCLLIEEVPWLVEIRADMETERKLIKAELEKNRKIKLTDDAYKNYSHLRDQSVAINARLQGWDARLDGKRKLITAIEEKMYLSPRSRAGVMPPEKVVEVLSAMDKLLMED